MNGGLASSDSIRAARRQALLAWYDAHGRDLPWRARPSLYGTWISEIMLQQTTVEAVRPRWSSFLDRFPDVEALALASEAEVLASWSGLGYYRRARLLHRAAREIVAAGGQLPSSRHQWRALPGIGDYTAGAIASIGLGKAEPAVDANIRRATLRWVCDEPDVAAQLKPKQIAELAAGDLCPERPGDWNQALMDLGATICTAERPDCERCPVARWCAAGRAGRAHEVPPPNVRATTTDVVLGALVVQSGSRVLLLPADTATVATASGLGQPRRRALDGLLAGTLVPPLTPWYGERSEATPALAAAWRRWLDERGVTDAVTACGTARHAITRYRLRIEVFGLSSAAKPFDTMAGVEWRDPAGSWPATTLARRCLERARRRTG